jgi:hypothetical protein
MEAQMKYRRFRDAERRASFREWKRVGSVLARIPVPAVSEGFVRSVMSCLQSLEDKKSEALSALSRWLFPAFAMAVVSLAFSVMAPLPMETMVSTDSLLFSQEAEPPLSQRQFSPERPGEDQIFGDLLENQ